MVTLRAAERTRYSTLWLVIPRCLSACSNHAVYLLSIFREVAPFIQYCGNTVAIAKVTV
jgi:hypothetical protein